MATKRTSLKERTDRDKEARGLDAIFESGVEAKPEAEPQANVAPKKSAPRPARRREAELARELLKVSYYIYADQDTTLEEIKIAVRKQSGARKDKSELIREAIDLLAKHYKVPLSQ